MENTKHTQLTVQDWYVETSPNRIVITASNGRELTIKPQHSYRDRAYQMWLSLLDDYDYNERAKTAVDTAITKMQ